MKYSRAKTIELINSQSKWFHRIDLGHDLITPGVYNGSTILNNLNIPEDCSGKRVLDLGTRDGFFAFEFERRGAQVVAVDYVPREKTGFHIASDILDSKVEYIHENIYNLSSSVIGTFDIVLFLGLLYHLPDPIRAINIVRSLSKDLMYLETQCIEKALLLPDGTFSDLASIHPILLEIPILQFYPNASLNNDPTNYWAPNLKALEAMLAECRFEVTKSMINNNRAIVSCKVIENARLAYFESISSTTVRKE